MPFAGGFPIIIFAIGGLVLLGFVVALFVLVAMDLRWRGRSIVLLVLLIFTSGIFSIFAVGGLSTLVMGAFVQNFGMPTEIDLYSASEEAGFDVYAPAYLPEGMRLSSTQLMPDFMGGGDSVVLEYRGGGEQLSVYQSSGGSSTFGPSAMPPGWFSYANDGDLRREKVKVKDQTGALTIDEGGFNTLHFEIGEIAIDVSSTLPKDELLRLAESLEKV